MRTWVIYHSQAITVAAILLLLIWTILMVGSRGPDSGPQPPYSEIAGSR